MLDVELYEAEAVERLGLSAETWAQLLHDYKSSTCHRSCQIEIPYTYIHISICLLCCACVSLLCLWSHAHMFPAPRLPSPEHAPSSMCPLSGRSLPLLADTLRHHLDAKMRASPVRSP
jgi:hypothetical protein